MKFNNILEILSPVETQKMREKWVKTPDVIGNRRISFNIEIAKNGDAYKIYGKIKKVDKVSSSDIETDKSFGPYGTAGELILKLNDYLKSKGFTIFNVSEAVNELKKAINDISYNKDFIKKSGKKDIALAFPDIKPDSKWDITSNIKSFQTGKLLDITITLNKEFEKEIKP